MASPARNSPRAPSRPRGAQWEVYPALFRQGATRGVTLWVLQSFPPLQHPLHQQLVEPVGRKTDERDREHDRKHGLVGAVVAEKADQIAEALARHDQLGAHKQDEGERYSGADAVEQL